MLDSTDSSLTADEIIQITLSPYFEKEKPGLVDLLRKSRSSLDSQELLSLQADIATRLIKLEKQISYFSTRADRAKHNQEWLSREIYKAHRRVLKNIADGIAWRYLKFRRAALRLLGEHKQVGFINSGFVEEIKEAEKIIARTGAFVLFNNITNILKHGDLTIIDDDKISLYEVKSGSKDRRYSRQNRRTDEVLNMLNQGKHIIGNQSAKVLNVSTRPTYLLEALRQQIKKAISNPDGLSNEKIAPYIWLSCFSVSNFTNYIRKTGSQPKLPSNPFSKGKYLLPTSNLTLFDSFSPNLAPYSVFTLEEGNIVDLLVGSIQIKTCIGEGELKDSFAGKGWLLSYPNDQIWLERLNKTGPQERIDAVRKPDYFPTMSKGGFTMKMPWEVFYRVGTEFLSVKSIVALLEYTKENSSRSVPETVIAEFDGSTQPWI